MVTETSTESNAAAGGASPAYRRYVVLLLSCGYMISYINRSLVSILQESLKAEFHLSDLQLGLLSGTSFALLYATLAVPVARLGERYSRVGILSLCLTAWSIMTSAFGVASGYALMFVARMGVSVGEAGCTPLSHSIISDYFPANRRATAISVFTVGQPIGFMLAALVGSAIAHWLGWRMAFILLGIPGVVLAIIMRCTLKEPPRSSSQAVPSLRDTLATLARKRTFRNLLIGNALAWLAAVGIGQYVTSFLLRAHGLTLVEASHFTGFLQGPADAVGLMLSGYIVDKMSKRHPLAIIWVPIIGLLLAAPCVMIAYLSPSLWMCGPAFVIGEIGTNLFSVPTYAMALGLVPSRMRSTASATVMLVVILAGYGFGPPLVGTMSDTFQSLWLSSHDLTRAACLAQPLDDQCASAGAWGLRYAMAAVGVLYIFAALLFARAGRTLKAEWEG